MKAVLQDHYGEVDVLHLRDVDTPTIAADEVLVRVKAAGMDPGVWHLMTGRPYLVRIIGFGLRNQARGMGHPTLGAEPRTRNDRHHHLIPDTHTTSTRGLSALSGRDLPGL